MVINILIGIACTKVIAQDLYDISVLYDSAQIQISDINFSKISKFYGLKCKTIDLTKVELLNNLLRDNAGNYLKGVAVSASNLEKDLLNTKELKILEQAIDIGGLNLLIYDICKNSTLENYKAVKKLVNGQIINITKTTDLSKDYIISSSLPEITREFTGIKMEYPESQEDYSITS